MIMAVTGSQHSQRWLSGPLSLWKLMWCAIVTTCVITICFGTYCYMEFGGSLTPAAYQTKLEDVDSRQSFGIMPASQISGSLTPTAYQTKDVDSRQSFGIMPASESTDQEKTRPLQFSGESSGYVIALSFWEQLTMSVMNLLDLQCWAARNRLTVVEPSLVSSYLKFTFDPALADSSSWMSMKDIYNMSDWNRHAAVSGLSPLMSRKQFLDSIAHQQMRVFLVHLGKVKGRCVFQWPKHAGKQSFYSMQHLEVAGTACIPMNSPSFEVFNERIFGQKDPPPNAVVMFNTWPGFEPIYIPGVFKLCAEGRRYVCQKPPSARLLNDARLYADKYLGGFGQYIAIAARFERPVAEYWTLKSLEYKEAIVKRIAEGTHAWEKMRKNTSLPSTFLSFDYGSFGSDTFRTFKRYCGAKQELEQFHQTVYENKLSLQDWEHSFEAVTHTNHTAYITLLHLQIAAHSRCLIIVGMWSNFQKVLRQTYLRLHPDNACVHVVGAVGDKHC